MSWVKCSWCNETLVPPGAYTRCVDCMLPTKDGRQQYFWDLEQRLESARWTTRKEFAAAAISTAAQEVRANFVGDAPVPAEAIANRAFEIADAMMEKSVWPISTPAPKETP